MEDKGKIVKTRIAPSPTGDFHIGQMRTVLYNYAYARQKSGTFLLRIEDTDRGRYVPGAEDRIMDTIMDYGLSWDEGVRVGGSHGPYVQSQRLDVYKKYALELVEKGYAYYCFCSKERLDGLRKRQQEAHLPTTKYDKHCLGLTPDEIKENLARNVPYVVRLNVLPGETIKFKDEVLGDLEFPSDDLDDQVLLKSDGFPTYHLAVVVDDHLMEVTHVFRGVDWLPSTPKHVLLYRAFGWELPVYAHLPNLKEVDENRKMSKRRGSAFAYEFLREGYLPEALNNFLMFLGWNPGTDKEMYNMQEFIKDFSLERIQKTDLVSFDRAKLLWMNGWYIRNTSNPILLDKISAWAEKWGVDLNLELADRRRAEKVLALVKDRMKTLSEFKALVGYFYAEPKVDIKAFSSQAGEDWKNILVGLTNKFADVAESSWTKENLDIVSYEFCSASGHSTKEVFMTLRLAVTGQTATPPLFDVLELLGKQLTQSRIKSVLETNSG